MPRRRKQNESKANGQQTGSNGAAEGGDFEYRHKVEQHYTHLARSKAMIRNYCILNSSIGGMTMVMALFRNDWSWNEIKEKDFNIMCGHGLNFVFVLIVSVISYLGVANKLNPQLIALNQPLSVVTLLTFIGAISVYILYTRQWSFDYIVCIVGLFCNLLPQVMLWLHCLQLQKIFHLVAKK
ncbi:hypothetical protein RFI_12900 [Reticulomyxa filosa]|uniref:Uncharacterized protein n=1 Tax=Reticulomyxa filosa TaxID=46433 RepID=X6ND49_RETFI|nr:hypothetical protein RFI_12900 [Reticulomyxa filosa]|eukprot:ETO24260.1 hypothetical protein RFI_12900 [Reticulomyxa filosa]